MTSHLTPAQLEQIEARTRAECEAQGVPFTVTDPGVLAKVARIVAGAAKAAA